MIKKMNMGEVFGILMFIIFMTALILSGLDQNKINKNKDNTKSSEDFPLEIIPLLFEVAND